MGAALLALPITGMLSACADRTNGPTLPEAIVLISLDTLRADYLNVYGYDRFESSPFLDRFASRNVLFENCIVVEPWTLTSHMSLLTGLLPTTHAVYAHGTLPDGIETLASLLRDRGYSTQGFVDGGYLSPRWGFDRGFDGYESVRQRGLGELIPRARSWIEAHRKQRFFLFLHTYDVHSKGPRPDYRSPPPWRGRFSSRFDSALKDTSPKVFGERFDERYEQLSETDREYLRATYAEGVRFVDEQLRGFFGFLERTVSYPDLLAIVWSDHGEGLYDHDAWGHAEVYDHTIHVPLIMKIPGLGVHGTRIRSVVSGIDIAPTILELAGVPIPESLEGRSMLPLLDDDRADVEVVTILTKPRRFSIRTARYQYVYDPDTQLARLFDLQDDPQERIDLHPAALPLEKQLRERLSRWIRDHPMPRAPGVRRESPDLDSAEQLRELGYVDDGPN